jgi:hypothetical protein
MTIITSKMFSPILPPYTKPTRAGWYVSGMGNERISFAHKHADCAVFMWWTGMRWQFREDGGYTAFQNRYWFGLTEEQK